MRGKSKRKRAPQPYRKLSPEKIRQLFEILKQTGNATIAAKEIGIARRSLYDRREKDGKFAAAWQDAIDNYVDRLEGEVDRRAFAGTDKPIYYLGKRVDTIKEYSDLLAIFRLKALRPEMYRERYEHTGPQGGPIPVMIYLPDNKRDGNSSST